MSTNETVVRGLVDALNRRAVDELGDYLAAGVVDHNKIIHGEPDEPGAAFEGLRRQLDAFDPYRMTVEELVSDGDRVAARIIQTGTHSGAHPRMPEPTGRTFRNEAMFLFTLAGGRITEIRAVSDRLGLFLQLGWDWPSAQG